VARSGRVGAADPAGAQPADDRFGYHHREHTRRPGPLAPSLGRGIAPGRSIPGGSVP